tara:strand:- start:301 stop:507 length:207 start_codon:yes stop_codon:yes gene_type:complete
MSQKQSAMLFKPDTEQVLVRGLNAMTKACDALSNQNETLNMDIEKMKHKIARLQEKILVNQDEKGLIK